jgi:hypothetical protein
MAALIGKRIKNSSYAASLNLGRLLFFVVALMHFHACVYFAFSYIEEPDYSQG